MEEIRGIASEPVESDAWESADEKVLIVDDQESSRRTLAEHLEAMGETCLTASGGVQALAIMRCEQPAAVLLDLVMPGMDGRAVLSEMQADERLRRIPVIVVSGRADDESVVGCLDLGAVDYLAKPIRGRVLEARLRNTLARAGLAKKETELRRVLSAYNLELEDEVARQVRIVKHANASTVFALSKLAESRDPETGDHLDRMRIYSRLLAVTMAQHYECYADIIDDAFAENIYAASPLHDIGKVAIPDAVLLNPNRLTPDEFEIMKGHCELGANTLRTVIEEFPENALIQMGIEIALGHHEKWDGSGYPHGVSGADIPLSCRIVALADVYDALTSKRCYKDAFSHEMSRDIIVEGNGTHFDPDVVDVFLLCEPQFNAIRARMQPVGDEVSR